MILWLPAISTIVRLFGKIPLKILPKKADKLPLREIESIGLTMKELVQIKTLNHLKYEKLVFVMLCHAKLL